MPELYLGTVALAPVIAGLVEAAKAAGLPSKFAPVLNAVLTVIAYYLVSVYLVDHPEGVQIAALALNCLVIFLSAAGLYTTVNFAVTKARPQ